MKNLVPGEVSAVCRVRCTSEVADWWKALTSEERGVLLEQLYVADAPRRERRANAGRRATAESLWATGEFATQGELAQHMGVSDTTVSNWIGRHIDGPKTRTEENSVLHGIVRHLLAQTDVDFSWKEVRSLARAAGDRRNDRKITYHARRLRQQIEKDAPPVVPIAKTAPQLIRKQFNAAQKRHRTAEEGQRKVAGHKTPQPSAEGQGEAGEGLEAESIH